LIRRHQGERAEAWLEATVRLAQEGAPLNQVPQRFLRREDLESAKVIKNSAWKWNVFEKSICQTWRG
jgi:hypothetical protein